MPKPATHTHRREQQPEWPHNQPRRPAGASRPKRSTRTPVQADMLTVEQVADRLQISAKTVRPRIGTGQIRLLLGAEHASVAGPTDASSWRTGRVSTFVQQCPHSAKGLP